MSSLFHIKEFHPSHTNFIKATWLKSFFLGKASLCENLTSETYYSEHAKLVDHALLNSKILIAISAVEPDVMLGYCVFKHPDIFHYIYVRHAFKKFGIARALFEASEIDSNKFTYTHRTRDCGWIVGYTKKVIEKTGEYRREFVPGKFPQGTYNPYSFLRKE